MPIRFTTDDTRSADQAAADDRTREEVERGGVWVEMTQEQRALVLARLRDKKQRAQAARARRQNEQESLEERVARLEERIARLGG